MTTQSRYLPKYNMSLKKLLISTKYAHIPKLKKKKMKIIYTYKLLTLL